MIFNDSKICFVKDLSVTYKYDLSNSAWRIVIINEQNRTLMIQRLTDGITVTCTSDTITQRSEFSYKYFLYRYPKNEIYSKDFSKPVDPIGTF